MNFRLITLFSALMLSQSSFALSHDKKIQIEEKVKSEIVWSLERSEFGLNLVGVSVDLVFSEKKKEQLRDFPLTYAPPYLGEALNESNETIDSIRVKVIFNNNASNEARRQITGLLKESYGQYPLHVTFAEKPIKLAASRMDASNFSEQATEQENSSSFLSTGAFVFLSALLLVVGIVFFAWILKGALSKLAESMSGLKGDFVKEQSAELSTQKQMQTYRLPDEPTLEFKAEIHLDPKIEFKPEIHVHPTIQFSPNMTVAMPQQVYNQALESWEQDNFELAKQKFLSFLDAKPALLKKVLQAQSLESLSLFKHLFKYLNQIQSKSLFKLLHKQKRVFKKAHRDHEDFPKLVRLISSVVDDLCMEEILSKNRWEDVVSADGIKRLRSMKTSSLAAEVLRLNDLSALSVLSDILLVGEFRSLVNELSTRVDLSDLEYGELDDVEGAQLLLSLLRPASANLSRTQYKNREVLVEERAKNFVENLDNVTMDDEYSTLAKASQYDVKFRSQIRRLYWSLEDLEVIPQSLLKDWFYHFDCHTLALFWKYSAGRHLKLQHTLHDFLISSGKKAEVVEWAISIKKYSERADELKYSKAVREQVLKLRAGQMKNKEQLKKLPASSSAKKAS
ncbi:hypothetical protein GW915_02360 [bacterium]|nr:hypothetical protein [bacterium]